MRKLYRKLFGIPSRYKYREDVVPPMEFGSALPIELCKGPYKGVVFVFGEVKLEEDSANGSLAVRFNFEIIEYGKHTNTLQPSAPKAFITYIGEILTYLIQNEDSVVQPRQITKE